MQRTRLAFLRTTLSSAAAVILIASLAWGGSGLPLQLGVRPDVSGRSASPSVENQAQPQSSLNFTTLYNFTNTQDGCCIYAGVGRDRIGNLYGVAYLNRGLGGGDLFKLTPGPTGYSLRVLQDFTYEDGECTATPAIDRL